MVYRVCMEYIFVVDRGECVMSWNVEVRVNGTITNIRRSICQNTIYIIKSV